VRRHVPLSRLSDNLVAVESYRTTSEHAGQRLDRFLAAAIPDVSRARVQQLIAAEKVQVDGRAQRASYRMRGDEEIVILGPAQPAPISATPEDIPLDVVYEDEALAVINKPAGMVVHAGAGQTPGEGPDPRNQGTLVNALLHRFRNLSYLGGELRPGIVHRLDKETSGLIVVAKTDSAHRKLAEQFSQRRVHKTYVALVHGWPKQESGTIRSPIGRDPIRRNRMSVRSREGRDAITHYRVQKTFDTHYGKFALLEVKIETGRTHQIRVHLAAAGHPVVGDHLYGAPRDIEPLASARLRARPANTKATRDRAASEIARRLTEEREQPVRVRRKQPSRPEPVTLTSSIRLDRNFLHAAALEFTHPRTGKSVSLRTELPPDLSGFLERLLHLSR
jgi:23S rRNA pseudouridine1911/1915/1917 synthase